MGERWGKLGPTCPDESQLGPMWASYQGFLSQKTFIFVCIRKKYKKCLLMPGLTDSGKNISTQCVDLCYISIKLLAFLSLFALQLNQTILLS